MATWQELARQNRTAAYELFAGNRWRSCLSRSHYAIYAEVIHSLHAASVTMPAGRSNPRHLRLSGIIGNHLISLDNPKRWRLAGLVKKLHDLRIIADYQPGVEAEQDEARVGMSLMTQAFECLETAS